MPLLAAVNISHAFGDRIILENVSLSIEAGERIGVVGRNGAGKSTLMKILTGQIAPDKGEVQLQRGCRAGYLHQDPKFDPDDTLRSAAEQAFKELHDLHAKQHEMFDKMATLQGAELDILMKQQAQIEARIEALGGYAVDHKIDAVLHGLGFVDAQFSIPVKGLSGGQKGRLALAQLLLEEPDVLLLDEPTNHLDIDGRLWLENFLKNEFKGAVVMVSHDRYLLDNVVTQIIETEQCRLVHYPGNYAAFRELRAERRLVMHRAYEAQQHKFKKEEEYIRRFKAGQRARQAKGRETRLDREKLSNTLERPMELATLALELPKAERSGDVVVSCRELCKSYTQDDGTTKLLFKNLTLSISRGERWGIIGPNGAGKSTLVRTLLGEQAPDSGSARIGSNVKIGHYKQTHEHVNGELPVYRYLQNVILKEAPGSAMSEQAARNLAGAFLFSGDEQERQMGFLSGGERSRAVLAGLLASSKNLLVLDEPTNHLDIPAAERLEDVLSDEEGYEGTLILISHDRALIDATCDHLLILDGQGNVEIYLGGYTDWHEKHTARQAEAARAEAEEKRRRDERERQQRAAEEAKKKAKPKVSGPSANALERLRTEQLEERIQKIEARLRQIDESLNDPEVWRDHAKSHKLGEERQKLQQDLEPLEFEWLRRAAD
ncbi:MAG: ABC-F family ATP-binding cassette domain-containing protein [Planctomycetota bacterium]|nr:ABC-F family ATP-binding cassette domain-containing protein [Planctomycetota bacterium]